MQGFALTNRSCLGFHLLEVGAVLTLSLGLLRISLRTLMALHFLQFPLQIASFALV